MNPSHLLDQARRLATEGPGRPRQDDLRRAVSAAYYAVFHLLVDAACGRIVGKTRRGRALRDALSRAFAHGEMASVCDRFATGNVPPPLMPAVPRGVPARLRVVARTFVPLQQQRHAADYDRAITFDRQRVLALIRETEDAVAAWAAVANDASARLAIDAFLIALLVGQRLRR